MFRSQNNTGLRTYIVKVLILCFSIYRSILEISFAEEKKRVLLNKPKEDKSENEHASKFH
jgi:hypothetical protein